MSPFKQLIARKNLTAILFLIFLVFSGAVFIFLNTATSASDSTAATIQTPVAALTVTTTKVRSLLWDDVIKASGTVVAWQEASIGAQLTGQHLTEVLVDVGDQVERGQVLARFDASTLLSEKALLLANLAQANALAIQADVDYQRMQQLSSSGAISKQNLLQAETQKKTTAAQKKSAQAQLSANELQLRYVDVVAPDAGVISARNATLGAVGSVGQELFRLIRDNRIEWQGELTSLQLKYVSVGQTIRLALPDGSSALAHIRQLAPTVNPQTRMLTIYATIEAGTQARPGMFAEGEIKLSQLPALVVPSASVVIRDGRSYLFLLKNNSPQVIQRAVQVKRRSGDDVEVVGDIAIGETVVTQGAGFLNDGDTVKVVSDNTAHKTEGETSATIAQQGIEL